MRRRASSTLRRAQQQTSQQLEQTRQSLSAERARHASIEKILSDRAYTADAVQKLFNAGDSGARGFRAVGLLADFAEVQEEYEGAVEQFLRDELQYVVVESFDQARTGIALLRDEMGGRATFFIDSAPGLDTDKMETGGSMPGDFIARLDRIVEFRDPLGPATKYFLRKLRTAYIVATPEVAERMAYDNPHSYFLTLDGTCYHGRTVSGGRKGEAGPLALKRELRHHETEAVRLDHIAEEQQSELTRLESEIVAGEQHVAAAIAHHLEAEKALVTATHQREQTRSELHRVETTLAAEREEIARLHSAAESARQRAVQARQEHEEATRSRAAAESEAAEAAERLVDAPPGLSAVLQERVIARREELATISERLASAESIEQRLAGEIAQANERVASLQQQHAALLQEKGGTRSLLRAARATGGIAARGKNASRSAASGARKGMGRRAVPRRPSG